MLVVADSFPLIALATCEGIDLILHLFDDIRVPKAVYQEVIIEGKSQSATSGLFLSEHVVEGDITHWVLAAGGLRRGEIEAMALYKQLSADALLVDDHRARMIAEHNQIKCIGNVVARKTTGQARSDSSLYRKTAPILDTASAKFR